MKLPINCNYCLDYLLYRLMQCSALENLRLYGKITFMVGLDEDLMAVNVCLPGTKNGGSDGTSRFHRDDLLR